MTSGTRSSSLHVYNARCALTVDPARNRADTVHTVNLETAARGAGADFAWEAKLVVQVTGRELPDVVATLLGLRARIECLHHGPRRDKGYRLFHDEGDRCVVQLFSGSGERHTVSLTPADRLGVVAMTFRQMQRNHGGLPADVLYAMLERVYAPPSADAAGPRDEPGPSVAPPAPPRTPGDAYDW